MPSLLLLSLLLLLFAVYGGAIYEKDIVLNGTYEVIPKNYIEVVYQLPPQQPIKGIVLLAHGCSHSATDWWPKSSSCESCIGLPIERTIVEEALRNGYIAVAQSSHNRKRKCWDSADSPRVVVALQHLIAKFNLPSNIFVHLLGASSGGGFVGKLALQTLREGIIPLKIASAVVQVMSLRIEPHKNSNQKIPGILFVHMERDTYTSEAISEIMSSKPIPTLKEIVASPLPLVDTYFYDHGKHLNKEDSTKLVRAFIDEGFVDRNTKHLKEDPRGSDWRRVAHKTLPDLIPLYDSMVADQSGISELLNVAWAMHEITDEQIIQTFQFMKSMEL